MPDNLLMWGAVGVGAWLLLGGMSPKAQAAPAQIVGGSPTPGPGPTIGQFGDAIGSIFAGLFASSADEDIGIAPVGPVAAPGPAAGTPIIVQDGNTPVIDQTPVLATGGPAPTIESTGLQTFNLAGTQSQGFSLLGPTEGLTGSTQIRVLADPEIAPVFESFATTPDVLAAYLAQFN